MDYCQALIASRLSSLTLYLSPLTSHYLQVDRRQRVPRWDLPAGAQVPDQDREVAGGSAQTGGLQQTRHSRQSPLQAQSQLSSHPGPGQAPDHHPLQPGGRAETLPGPLPGEVEGREGQAEAAGRHGQLQADGADQDGAGGIQSGAAGHEGHLHGPGSRSEISTLLLVTSCFPSKLSLHFPSNLFLFVNQQNSLQHNLPFREIICLPFQN